jgi:hypothetical protein
VTEETVALARRAVSCKGWRWMPGMADLWGGRVREGDGIDRVHALPDLTDPATLGCLLALVREAWRCPTVYVRQSRVRRVSDGVLAWEVKNLWLDAEACRCLGIERQGGVQSWGHASEAEALVAALEAAP